MHFCITFKTELRGRHLRLKKVQVASTLHKGRRAIQDTTYLERWILFEYNSFDHFSYKHNCGHCYFEESLYKPTTYIVHVERKIVQNSNV